jgi:hypothetical protein
MHKGRLGGGLALAVAAGALLGHAWVSRQDSLLSVAILVLGAGVLLAVSAFAVAARGELRPAGVPRWDHEAAPALGEMLVGLSLISRHDLQSALAQQRGSPKRLGQILVDMGLLTHPQLAEILEDQLSRRSGRFLWHRPRA